MPDGCVAGRPLRALAAAVTFLTRLPVRGSPLGPEDFVRGAVLFPLVGAAIGAAVGSSALVLAGVLAAPLAATIAVGLELIITGALHIDGLADSADALAGRDRDRALQIMADHSLGTYGASALVLNLLAKVWALALLAQADAFGPVIAAYAVSRAAPLPLAASLRYARSGPGTGRLLAERLGTGRALTGLALAAAVAVAATGVWALAALGCLAATAATVGLLARRRIGGVTGDVMGAAIELTSTAALIAAASAQA